jgi:hypothetical protein
LNNDDKSMADNEAVSGEDDQSLDDDDESTIDKDEEVPNKNDRVDSDGTVVHDDANRAKEMDDKYRKTLVTLLGSEILYQGECSEAAVGPKRGCKFAG